MLAAEFVYLHLLESIVPLSSYYIPIFFNQISAYYTCFDDYVCSCLGGDGDPVVPLIPQALNDAATNFLSELTRDFSRNVINTLSSPEAFSYNKVTGELMPAFRCL
jgi:hypothetical protein